MTLEEKCGYYMGLKFIFGGRKGSQSITDGNKVDLCDFVVWFDIKKQKYKLVIEKAIFYKSSAEWIQWLENCLGIFTSYMEDNGLDMNVEYDLFFKHPQIIMEAGLIEELYTNFRMFVAGYKSLYGGDKA